MATLPPPRDGLLIVAWLSRWLRPHYRPTAIALEQLRALLAPAIDCGFVLGFRHQLDVPAVWEAGTFGRAAIHAANCDAPEWQNQELPSRIADDRTAPRSQLPCQPAWNDIEKPG